MLGARASVIKFIIGLFGLVSLVGIEGRAVPDIYLIAIPGIKPLPCRDTSPLRPVVQVTVPHDVVDLFAVKPVELG